MSASNNHLVSSCASFHLHLPRISLSTMFVRIGTVYISLHCLVLTTVAQVNNFVLIPTHGSVLSITFHTGHVPIAQLNNLVLILTYGSVLSIRFHTGHVTVAQLNNLVFIPVLSRTFHIGDCPLRGQ